MSLSAPHHIVILTGAGISAESGIDTFRADGGLWEQYPIEQVATPEGYARDPALVHHFYNLRRAALRTVEPNAAHTALATLQEAMETAGRKLTLITQNVDDLHERGGSTGVIHMHGQLLSMLCAACGWRWDSAHDHSVNSVCPSCQTVGGPRPDVVWFGEMPYAMRTIEAAVAGCDLFVSIGTSGAVYPAAGFVQLARERGIATLELNLEPSQGSHQFDESRMGKASALVPAWTAEITALLS